MKTLKRTLLIAAIIPLLSGCTKPQAVAVANTILQVGVEFCHEAPTFVPGPPASGVVALLCAAYGSNEQVIQTIVDSTIWNSMKAAYLKEHASLPAGMSDPKAAP